MCPFSNADLNKSSSISSVAFLKSGVSAGTRKYIKLIFVLYNNDLIDRFFSGTNSQILLNKI